MIYNKINYRYNKDTKIIRKIHDNLADSIIDYFNCEAEYRDKGYISVAFGLLKKFENYDLNFDSDFLEINRVFVNKKRSYACFELKIYKYEDFYDFIKKRNIEKDRERLKILIKINAENKKNNRL